MQVMQFHRKSCLFLILFAAITGYFLIVTSAWAELRYVEPKSEIPLRSGQGTKYRILAVIQDGTKVELLTEDGPWARIRLQDGKEGWVLKRYLTKEPPLSLVVQTLKSDKRRLEQELLKTRQQLETSIKKHEQCAKELKQCTFTSESLKAKYDELKADAADVLNLRNDLEQTKEELTSVQQRLDVTMEENKHLKKNDRIKWFLAGGGVLLAGWLIGLVMGRGRRRRPSLL